MSRRTFNPDMKDPKFKDFVAKMRNMAEVGEWLAAMGFGETKIYELRKEIIENCEVIQVKSDFLATSETVMCYLKNRKEQALNES